MAATARFQFPKDFRWGTATAAYQVEGHGDNADWWAWEQAGKIINSDSAAVCNDWWGGRYIEDFDRMVELHNTHARISVAWERIEPSPSVWNEDAIAFYRDMLTALRDRDIVPMVTLSHFSVPIWFLEQGGWMNDDAPVIFERFVRKVVRELGDLCTEWMTLNEPNGYAVLAYLAGDFPPGHESLTDTLKVSRNMFRAHVAGYHAVKAVQPESFVGYALAIRLFDPDRPGSPLDRWAARQQFNNFNVAWPNALRDGVFRTPLGNTAVKGGKDALDFMGLQYYTRDMVRFDLSRPNELFGRRFFREDDELSHTGFIANYPEGMFRVVDWARKYGKPLIISESGVEDPEDSLRRRYLLQHLRHLWRAVNFTWPVLGFYHWTLVDNFEWERGWSQRFGLYELDLETYTRKARPSASMYAEIARMNGFDNEIVARYAPELLDELFPVK